MTDDGDQRTIEESAPVHLSRVARWISGVVGGALVGAGSAAVFVTDNQAGSLALLTLGGFSVLLGLVGRIPERGGVGSANWEYMPLTRLLSSEDSRVRETAADAVLADPQLARDAPTLTARAHDVLREADAIRSLQLFIESTYPNVTIHREPRRPYAADGPDSPSLTVLRPDLVLEVSAGSRSHWVPLEVARGFHPVVVDQAVRYAHAWESKIAIVAVLNWHGITSERMTLEVDNVRVAIVPFSPELEHSSLRRALDVTLGEAGPT